jgi:hypothetical protein
MNEFILDRLVKERQRELLEAAALQRLVGPHRLGAYGVVVRLMTALRTSEGHAHEAHGKTAEVRTT